MTCRGASRGLCGVALMRTFLFLLSDVCFDLQLRQEPKGPCGYCGRCCPYSDYCYRCDHCVFLLIDLLFCPFDVLSKSYRLQQKYNNFLFFYFWGFSFSLITVYHPHCNKTTTQKNNLNLFFCQSRAAPCLAVNTKKLRLLLNVWEKQRLLLMCGCGILFIGVSAPCEFA